MTKKYIINVESDGNDIYVRVNPHDNKWICCNYEGILLHHYYEYTWFDKHILRITKEEKIERIRQKHENFWNRKKLFQV